MQYGKMSNQPGVYVLNKIPECGNFEYIYKNKKAFLKVDQFGPVFMQQNPPAGMFALQRKEREIYSPIKYFFKDGGKLIHNFDIYNAKKFEIRFYPYKAEYELHFNNIDVLTILNLDDSSSAVYMSISVSSKNGNDVECLASASFDPIDSCMAVWDKKEWYSSTEVDGNYSPMFIVKHYSVNGDIKERKNIVFLQDKNVSSLQNSAEKLRYLTKNFTVIPKTISNCDIDKVVCYEQICGARFTIKSKESIKCLIQIKDFDETINKEKMLNLLSEEHIENTINNAKRNYESLIQKRTINTPDVDFNNFVNHFLPLELSWVSDLDRGWATGMRGSRDCANDFLGYLSYDLAKCRDVLVSLLSNERFEDGWFPRQIPVGGSNKYDLRPFSDSGAFVIELFYEYLCYSNDFSILEESFSYYGNKESGTGLEHLIKAAQYYNMNEHIGEHGLIKLNGGDWLDCLNRVGLNGRGESLMVTCQSLLAFRQVNEILSRYGTKYQKYIKDFLNRSKSFIDSIKHNCYLKEEGFYRSLFSDDGNWYFSNCDKDGNKRIYIPSNAYTIISKVDSKLDKKVIKSINNLNESKYGYKLFTIPFGNPPFEGIGKMGTGDFYPYMFENGAVYNHGANLFYVRALAVAGDYKTLFRALNYALPYNPKFHPEDISCLPSYACTNAYNLVPTFTGRSGMSFLTGSIAMIERSIYNWMFGLQYHPDYLCINPCIPSQYKNSEVTENYNGNLLHIKFHGFGNKIVECYLNGLKISLVDGELRIDKGQLKLNATFDVVLNKK